MTGSVTLIKQAFPNLRIDTEDIVAAEDRVAVRLTLHGTHTGEYLGFAPTGRPVSYLSHEFYRVADGLIVEEWICSDTATLCGQLAPADRLSVIPHLPESSLSS